MDLLEFEDIKEIFLQFKSLHKNIQELTSKKSNREGLSARRSSPTPCAA